MTPSHPNAYSAEQHKELVEVASIVGAKPTMLVREAVAEFLERRPACPVVGDDAA